MTEDNDEYMDRIDAALKDAVGRLVNHCYKIDPDSEFVFVLGNVNRKRMTYVVRATCLSPKPDMQTLDAVAVVLEKSAGVFSGEIDADDGPYITIKDKRGMN